MLKLIFAITTTFLCITLYAQPKVIDKQVAIVGGNIIKFSEIEQQYLQYLQQGNTNRQNIRCVILDELLYQKLLLNQAQLDSIEVTMEQIDGELDRRMRYFVEQLGSEQKLEEFYGKTVVELKEEFRPGIREQLMVQQMESKINENIEVTPTEVKDFYNSLPEDSLPIIPSEVEIGRLLIQPPVSEAAKQMAYEKINTLRERIAKGEDFSALAVLYSEDPGSARKGGELGSTGRGAWYPEFESMAFSLKDKQVSKVIKTKAGYHILQLIDRKGEYVNVKHILIQPKVALEDLATSKARIDSVYTRLNKKEITFEESVAQYADKEAKNNKGLMVNPTDASSKFAIDQLDRSTFVAIDKLKVGEYSRPILILTEEGQQAYCIYYLKSRTEPHRANIKSDYDRIKQAAQSKKKQDALEEWTIEKIKKAYIQVDAEYQQCDVIKKWLN